MSSVIDVRNDAVSLVNTIVFADRHESCVNATHLAIGNAGLKTIRMYDEDGDFVCITSAEHGENLIKAVRKAIELRWVV